MMNYFSNRKKWMAYLVLLTFVFTCIVPTNIVGGNSEAWADTGDGKFTVQYYAELDTLQHSNSGELAIIDTSDKNNSGTGAKLPTNVDGNNMQTNPGTAVTYLNLTSAGKVQTNIDVLTPIFDEHDFVQKGLSIVNSPESGLSPYSLYNEYHYIYVSTDTKRQFPFYVIHILFKIYLYKMVIEHPPYFLPLI